MLGDTYPQQLPHQVPILNASTQAVHHILTGSFRALSLALLAFSPFHRSLELVQHVPALGPHQYLTTNAHRDVVYATSWSQPPTLSSWAVQSHPSWKMTMINIAPIIRAPFAYPGTTGYLTYIANNNLSSAVSAATSSYISLPPPFTHVYSVGGPTGEVHRVDTATGGFGEKVQEILFIPPEELDKADKTRTALRFGSHAVEISARGHVFVPHLGTNSIHMFTVDRNSGLLTLLSKNESPRSGDGPRHVVISPDGNLLYSVTEHTNYVDIYFITATDLMHRASRSLLPPTLRGEADRFRGDTLRLTPPTATTPRPTHLFATTRGGEQGARGWLTVFQLDADGLFVGVDSTSDTPENEEGVMRWETPTSGGKANAIELRAKDDAEGDGLWIVLTDDDYQAGSPAVRVLQWSSAEGISSFAQWPMEAYAESSPMEGASHAIWLD